MLQHFFNELLSFGANELQHIWSMLTELSRNQSIMLIERGYSQLHIYASYLRHKPIMARDIKTIFGNEIQEKESIRVSFT
jgi:hypothetical protein